MSSSPTYQSPSHGPWKTRPITVLPSSTRYSLPGLLKPSLHLVLASSWIERPYCGGVRTAETPSTCGNDGGCRESTLDSINAPTSKILEQLGTWELRANFPHSPSPARQTCLPYTLCLHLHGSNVCLVESRLLGRRRCAGTMVVSRINTASIHRHVIILRAAVPEVQQKDSHIPNS